MATILEGKRINLRSLRKSDAEIMQLLCNDEELSMWTENIPFPYRLSDAEWFIDHTKKSQRKKKVLAYELGIALMPENKIIGAMGLMHINYTAKHAEVGYWIGRPYWRQGFAREALDMILKFAFKDLKLNRVYARVAEPNVGSCKVLEKAGFEQEGIFKEHMFKRGRLYDEVRYGLLRKNY